VSTGRGRFPPINKVTNCEEKEKQAISMAVEDKK